MQKILYVSIVLSLVFSALSASADTFNRTLRLGSSGAEVSTLQNFLKQKGYYTFPQITGYFGAVTQKAVIDFQQSQGIEAVGSVGPITRNILNSLDNTSAAEVSAGSLLDFDRSLQIGSSGEDVSRLQQFLKNQGYFSYPEVTGYFGVLTERAVISFQRASGIQTTGTMGPITRTKIGEISKITISNNKGVAIQIPPKKRRRAEPPHSENTVLVASHDIIAPAVSITSPLNGATVNGSAVTLIATASDDTSVAGVRFSINGVSVGSDITSSPYSLTWDSTATSSGTKVITAVAWDASGNQASSTSITVTADNAGPIISSISSGVPDSTSATITWTTDEVADSKVVYGLTSSYGTASTSALLTDSHSISLAGLSANTAYHFAVVSKDASGNTSTSTDQTFMTAIIPMPSGAIGIWYADQYQTSPRKGIPNSVAGGNLSSNLFSAPRHLFSNGGFYPRTNATVTDNATTCPDGLLEASTVVWGSGDAYLQPVAAALPAGTYTLAVDAKTTDGSSVNFRMGPNGSMATKTATPSWQSFSMNFTLNSTQDPSLLLIRSLNTSTPANLAICNARLFTGSTDLGADTLAGHMYFGSTNFISQPTYSSGVLTLNASGKFGVIQFPSSHALTSWTAIAIGQRAASPGGQYQSFLSKIQDYQSYTALWAGGAGGAAFQYGGATPINDSNSLWEYKDNDWHVITNRYSSPTASLFMEDVPLFSGSGTNLSSSIQDLWVGVVSNSGIFTKYAFNAIALYDRALSDVEVRQAVASLESRAASSSIATIGNNRFLVAEGDSITFGTNSSRGSYAARFAPNSNPAVNGRVVAQAGATLSGNFGNSLNSRVAAVDALLPANKNGRTFILSVLIGRNDLVGYSGGATQYAADVATYVAARKAAGWDKIVLCTLLPSTVAGFNTQRNLLNAIYTAPGWATAHNVDAICDFAADPTMGPDAAASDTSLYGDGTHPTDAGQDILEGVYRATINAL